ncbi:MAG: undecaprenyl/decaprenyl-phosphate alpha-N-acetylglucosaminyl 1-phosphate transferase [Firmicutes bacterium]|nr:undecaprenyl/decaprenyl-phosphate alpha-N-acetylglucosaminyl 1-phosphate transferase [Bacillota bacterium]MBR0179572.1 undecaprenyl/decaprenyl-phosphate alpha-N-acetylglucosaminyl 1-phosphate transferase [Bacillota bacterium]
MRIWLAVAAAFAVALAMTWPSIWLAHKLHIVDMPNARKVHTAPTPRVGGIAIYLGFVAGALLLGVYTRQVAAVLIAGSVVFLTGFIDDYKDISPKFKLAGQFVAALILVAAGFSIRFISNPFTGSTVSLGVFGIPITVLWLVGVSNAVNLIDGMDGLAGGVSAIAAVATAIVCLSQGELVAAALAGILAASALGFLPWNFHPAKTFMGDCGALFMGFILGTLALMGLCKGATAISVFIPFLILGVPVFDTFCAIIRRLFLHKPIFEADKMHLHQVLLSLGLGQRQAVLTIYVFAMLMGLAAVLMAILTSAQAVMVLIITTVATFAGAEILGTLRGKCHLSPIKRDKQETA